ncbi:MAG: beta-propeller fold lactonase family protein [Streptomyces sp.]
MATARCRSRSSGPRCRAARIDHGRPARGAGGRRCRSDFPAEVAVAAGGRTVYVSNRGHNSVAWMSVGGGGEPLKPRQVGQVGAAGGPRWRRPPRAMALGRRRARVSGAYVSG